MCAFSVWRFQARLPVERSSFSIQLPPGWKLEAHVFNHEPVAPVVQGGSQALLVLDKTAQGIRQVILEAVHFVPLKSGVA